MAIEDDIFAAPKKKPVHEIGQPLDALSVHELDERIDALRAEIARLEAAKAAKAASAAAEVVGPDLASRFGGRRFVRLQQKQSTDMNTHVHA